jgi:hypothetical protein
MAMVRRLFLFALGFLAVAMVMACQQRPTGETPAGSGAPSGGVSPGGGTSPIAPAIEPSHPDAERTIPLPTSLPETSVHPIAPNVEDESRPDPTIPSEPE